MTLFSRDRLLFMLLGFAAHDGPLVAYHLACRVLRSSGLCSQYLIQSRAPPPELMSKAIRQIAFGHIVLQLPLLWFAYDLFECVGMPQLNAPWPPMWTIALQFLFFMVVCDTLLYWAHRSLHHRLLYATFHKQHHDFKSNDALASEYFSPVEELLTVRLQGAGPREAAAERQLLWPPPLPPVALPGPHSDAGRPAPPPRAHGRRARLGGFPRLRVGRRALRVCVSGERGVDGESQQCLRATPPCCCCVRYDFPWSPFRLGRPCVSLGEKLLWTQPDLTDAPLPPCLPLPSSASLTPSPLLCFQRRPPRLPPLAQRWQLWGVLLLVGRRLRHGCSVPEAQGGA